MPHGTFSDLFVAFPTFNIRNRRVDIFQDNEESILALFRTRITVGCGTLLSMVPEIRDHFKLVTGRCSRTYPLEISTASDPRSVRWDFQLGDGESRPSPGDVANSFPGFPITERYGKVIITVPAAESYKIRATIYTDIRGRFWYVENPFFPIIMPEICLHFLLTNVFSNVMRYSPDHWGEVLLNQVKSDISLITRKYLSAYENKCPVLLLRAISRFYPFVSGDN